MLSLHTNNAALSAQNSLTRTQSSLSTSMTRLSTGYRINSAMDDAAGLQIATRLKAQTSGMAVAMRNTQNSISMLQTAEGALDEVGNILVRMKDLATQAADGSSSAVDDEPSADWVARSFMRVRMLVTSSSAPSAVCIIEIEFWVLRIATAMPLVWAFRRVAICRPAASSMAELMR